MSTQHSSISADLSPQGLALYQRMMEDATFIKRQQWATTNYAALIYGAIIWVTHNTSIAESIGGLLIALSVITATVATGLLIRFQYELYKLRKRIAGANSYLFGTKEKAGLEIEETDPHPFRRGAHILAILIMVCIAGAALASIIAYPRLG
jgi:hypothetical protein